MHDQSVSCAAAAARAGGPELLAQALLDSRRDTLTTFAAYEAALPALQVPLREELNPPLWELGHIAWFQGHWLARNPHRMAGTAADPEAPRRVPHLPGADALYNSSQVPHATRWQLPLPDARATCKELQRELEESLGLLAQTGRDGQPADDDALYFFRLALLHEDMHHEAALYMAQSLGIAIEDDRWQARPLPPPPAALALPAARFTLGRAVGPGFAFDNELGAHAVALDAVTIDAQVLRWAEFLPFIEDGGYTDPRCWSPAGQAWLATHGARAPRYLRREGRTWLQWRDGHWQALDVATTACHLTHYEAQAWCRWARRRLPTEAEWEHAAVSRVQDFHWGEVWEWTASAFAPYPGFQPHPYRDYSAPWFDGRPVLRGASFMTQPRLHHPRYRNFFLPHRNDLAAGFRSCALGA